jgi:hypothetical protein
MINKNLFATLALGLPMFATAQALPTHCQAGEVSLVNAVMGKGGSSDFKPNGKVLSVCADREKDPNRVAYRYGKVGSVELDQAATPQAKIAMEYRYLPRTHLYSLWFTRGNLTYSVTECEGMCNEVRIDVHQGKKRIAEFSAFDYESKLSSMDFKKTSSPVLIVKTRPFEVE